MPGVKNATMIVKIEMVEIRLDMSFRFTNHLAQLGEPKLAGRFERAT